MTGYLRVRAGTAWYGLSVDQVVRVVDDIDVLRAPGSHRSVVGVAPIDDRLVPLVRLASLIADSERGEELGRTAVVARCLGSLVAFEVDDVEDLVADTPRPVPESWRLPWAKGVLPHEGLLTPIIDLDVLAERLLAGELEMRNAGG